MVGFPSFNPYPQPLSMQASHLTSKRQVCRDTWQVIPGRCYLGGLSGEGENFNWEWRKEMAGWVASTRSLSGSLSAGGPQPGLCTLRGGFATLHGSPAPEEWVRGSSYDTLILQGA